jgi:hypothetical protein
MITLHSPINLGIVIQIPMIEKYVRFVFFTQPSVTAALSPQLAIDQAVDDYCSGVKLS